MDFDEAALTVLREEGGPLHWTVVQAADETATPCEPVAASVRVTPPDETTQLVLAWAYGPVCQHGRIDAGPLAPGTGPP